MARLKREIGLFGATMYCLGIIIGAGVYVLIGEATRTSGNAVWLSFLIASMIAGVAGIAYAELSSMIPRDAAEFLYSKRAFKKDNVAFGVGWVKLFSSLVAGAAVSIGFGRYLSALTGLDPTIGAILLILFLVILNILGIRQTIRANIVMVCIIILGLLIIIISGMGNIGSVDLLVMPLGIGGIFSAAALIFFAYLGFEDIANLGEEAKEPRKTLPRALIISLFVSAILYVLVAIVCVSTVPWAEFADAEAPLSLVAEHTLGGTAGIILTGIALFATASTVLGFFLAYSRMVFGMAEEGILPKMFLRLTKRSQVPYVAVIILGVISALFVLFSDLVTVASISDWGAMFVFLMVNVSLIVLRYREPYAKREFRVPLSIGKFPVIPAFGIAFCIFLLIQFDASIWAYSVLLFSLGIVLYYLFRTKKEEMPKTKEEKIQEHIEELAKEEEKLNKQK